MSTKVRAPIPFARHGARRGLYWLKQAFTMFRAAPLPWMLLLFTYYLILALLELGPWTWIGEIVAPLLKPVFAVGFLAAAWAQERGGRPKFQHLFRGFRSNLYALLPLGAFLLIGVTIAIFATTLVDGGKLIALMSGAEKPSEELLRSGVLQTAMLFGAACALPTLLAMWFAPALVVFNDAGAITALSVSLRAAIANWRPFAVYGLVVFALGGVLPALALALLQALQPVLASVLALFFVMPYFFVFIATLHISDYVSYRDVFHSDEPVQPGQGEGTSA